MTESSPVPAECNNLCANDYSTLLRRIKLRVQIAQNRIIYNANEELLRMYWDFGSLLQQSQTSDGWGKTPYNCRNKDRIKAEYALRDIQKPIGISEYKLGQSLPQDFRGSLPSIEQIEEEPLSCIDEP